MKRKIIFLLLLAAIFSPGITQASDDRELYSQAVENAREGNKDFAFMYFKDIIERYPDSPYTEAAVFACGEYYYRIADYDDALRMFGQLEAASANPKETLFVLMYLFKIAEAKKEWSFLERLKKDIITFKRLSFLFRNFKEYKYRSPLFGQYRAVYYIDKVEFYIDGELFAQISY